MATLTKEERNMLIASGHSKSDITEIVSAIKKAEYSLLAPDGKETPITFDEAVSILGREEWARGIARATFYNKTTRYGLNDEKVVICACNYIS